MNQVRSIRITNHLFAAAAVTALAACGGGDESAPVVAQPPPSVSAQQACSTLEGKSVGGASVTAAAMVAATATVPTYCKISALIAPKLNMELRLPASWNGKLHYGGGGGYNGSIPAVNTPALSAGYAQVSSDSGHQGGGLDASFALNDSYAAYLFGSGKIEADPRPSFPRSWRPV